MNRPIRCLFLLSLLLTGCHPAAQPVGPEPEKPDPSIPVASLSLQPETVRLEQGQSKGLRVTISPSDATDILVSWSSSDASVASVSAEGIVTAAAIGSAEIQAVCGDRTATCAVRVIRPTDRIFYRTSDRSVLEPASSSITGRPASNTYGEDGGVMVFGKSLTGLGDKAFYGRSLLTEIHLPETITQIGSAAFRGCTGLVSMDLPEDLIRLGDDVFYHCTALRRVTVPAGVEYFGTGAFTRCTALLRFESPLATPDGRCLMQDGTLIAFAPAGIGGYTLPEGTRRIDPSAMSYCPSLKSVILPSSVESIGDYAFSQSSSLESVTLLGETPPTLGAGAFDGLSPLYSIRVPASALDTYRSAPAWRNLSSRILALD